MKKYLSVFLILLSIVSFSSCSSKEKTIANLKVAIDGEATASAKYSAYADRALKDSIYGVEVLFRATSKAEGIHLSNHQVVLKSLGVSDYAPKVGQYDVYTTTDNLQSAIAGETMEFSTMYPTFIAEAKLEGVEDAIISFNYALDTEMRHAKIYAETLSQLANGDKNIVITYYVCPKCGNVYVGIPDDVCKLCHMSKADFIPFVSAVKMADGITGASPK